MSTAAPLWRRIDWWQVCVPGPTRHFSAAELHRAGVQGPSPTAWAVLLSNAFVLSLAALMVSPSDARRAVALLMLGASAGILPLVAYLWRRPPTRLRLTLIGTGLSAAGTIGTLALARGHLVADPRLARWLSSLAMLLLLLCVLLVYAIALLRSQEIAARLKELDERDAALALARRLSAAQLQPHFLFNTLASLQHWVDTQDPRAGPTLQSLTAYLRALLPMFEQPQHPLGQELDAMERYLEVMRQRLGTRLRARIERSPQAESALLPPGLGLTLLENAIEHGVLPSLQGAEVVVRCGVDDGRAWLSVCDTGPGPVLPHQDGVGLRNCRERLAQLHAAAASLCLENPPDGGCRVTVAWPHVPLPMEQNTP